MTDTGWLTSVLMFFALALPLGVEAQDDFLEPAQAFKLALQQKTEGGSLSIQFEVAPGHYMYGEAFQLQAVDGRAIALQKPAGVRKFDETFQKEVDTHRARVHLVAEVVPTYGDLLLSGQGCADRGLCYPPIHVRLAVQNGQWVFAPVLAPDLNFGRTAFVEQRLPSSAVPSGPLRLDILLTLMAGLLGLFGLWAFAQKAES
jgi:thioredoxin:protein disulfide reductase